jgi:hypothetical protein
MQVMYISFYVKCCQASSIYKALHTPWCHFISGFWWVSLAEYILILRVYSLLLQMMVYRGYYKTAFIRPRMRSRLWVWSFYIILSIMLLLEMTMKLACNWTKCDVGFKTTLLPLLLNLVVTTLWTPMYVRYFWTICELWCNMCMVYVESCTILVACWLVWNLSWFHRNTGFIWAQVWQFNHFGDCYRTCALINWTVLLHSIP